MKNFNIIIFSNLTPGNKFRNSHQKIKFYEELVESVEKVPTRSSNVFIKLAKEKNLLEIKLQMVMMIIASGLIIWNIDNSMHIRFATATF